MFDMFENDLLTLFIPLSLYNVVILYVTTSDFKWQLNLNVFPVHVYVIRFKGPCIAGALYLIFATLETQSYYFRVSKWRVP